MVQSATREVRPPDSDVEYDRVVDLLVGDLALELGAGWRVAAAMTTVVQQLGGGQIVMLTIIGENQAALSQAGPDRA